MEHKEPILKTARVIAQHRGKYRVKCEDKEIWATVTGKSIFTAKSQLDYPVVGDMVNIVDVGSGDAVIKEILPRKSILERKAVGLEKVQPIASNVDTVFIVQAIDRDFNLNRFERYVTIIRAGNILPVLVLNKIDLISPEELKEKVMQVNDRLKDTPLLTTSILTENGIDGLIKAVKNGQIYSFLGSSGVGKSSLINKLLGHELLKTEEISAQTQKGKHTTTHRELYELKNGAMVIDNPGMREVGLADVDVGVSGVFAEIEFLGKDCKFSDCSHQSEPGCAVLAAVKAGDLSESKYENYIKLKKEAEYFAMTSLEKRNKDRSFGKMVKVYKGLKKKLK
jgi:ribosome biogenesis GTPase / thiamine phosphate phosphatase